VSVPTLHVHLDESGNFTFSLHGTKYYVFSAAWTYDPAPLAQDLTRLRFSLLKDGHNIAAFHATEDKQENRDSVVNVLVGHNNWEYAGIVIEKAKVNPAIRDPHIFYPKFASMVLKYIFRRLEAGTSTVLIFTDHLPVQKYRDSAEKAIKKAARASLPPAVRFEAYHHRRESNAWIQVADYCSWAVFKRWERGDPRTYDLLRPRLATPELDVLAKGATRYY
jgi:hypothetical protein